MKMNVKGNDNFRTPDHVFNQLNSIFNFTLDAACTFEDCKCSKGFYHDEGIDALKISWGGGSVSSVIRRLVRKLLLSRRLITRLSMEIVRFVLWFCRATAKIARRFNLSLKRISFMKLYPDALPLSIRKQNNQ